MELCLNSKHRTRQLLSEFRNHCCLKFQKKVRRALMKLNGDGYFVFLSFYTLYGIFSCSLADLHPDNEGVDNRELIDTNDSQRVTQEKINDLREQGVKPEAIVRALKEGSTTFNQKTVFSREKWLREKIKKYTRRFRVEKATMRTILDTIRAKNNAKYLYVLFFLLRMFSVLPFGSVGDFLYLCIE